MTPSDLSDKFRVFVVDDESVIASSLTLILRQVGYDATSFSLPLAALQAARTEAPNLLIADVVMPVLSGVELAVRIRSLCPDCKVLLFSGQAGTPGILEATTDPAHDCSVLSKQIHPTELLKRVEILLQISSVDS